MLDKLFPGDLIELEKASFLLCCSRVGLFDNWLKSALDTDLLLGIILKEGQLSFDKIADNDEWTMFENKKNMVYKVYIRGKIIEISERSIGVKIQ